MKILNLLSILIVSIVLFGCENKTKWNTTREGYYYWGKEEDNVYLSWAGDEIGGLVHNKGIISKFNSSGERISSEKIKAFYGIIDKKEFLPLPGGGKYLGEENKNHLPNGFGVYKNNDTIIIGNFKKGLADGEQIIVVFKDTIIYKGNMKDGLFNGNGNIYKHNKLVYEGTFKNGKYHGYGILYDHGRIKYKGEWKDNLYHGNGTLYSDGKVQNGEWSAGQLEEGFFEGTINETGRIWNVITRNEDKNNIIDLEVDRSYDSPNLFADSLTNQLYEYVTSQVNTNIENRFGMIDLIRILYQGGGFIYTPYGIGERMKFFFEATNKGLSKQELQDWINTKIVHYNEITLSQTLDSVVFNLNNS